MAARTDVANRLSVAIANLGCRCTDDDACDAHQLLDQLAPDPADADAGPGADQPPAWLPATLASVDDVRRVCEAAGLTGWDGGYRDQRVLVYAPRGPNDEDDQVEVRGPAVSGTPPVFVALALGDRTPGAMLWHAVQAARSAPQDGR